MDRFAQMKVFSAVINQGCFTSAAKKLGVSKSAVSRHISALERYLGASLLIRTTRRVSPTEIGLTYYDHIGSVLNGVTEAEGIVSAMQSAPLGLLRVSVATDFGVEHVSPKLYKFIEKFPDITVDMVLKNRHTELISEGFDVAVRIGEMEDSTLMMRKIAETKKRLIASPAYLEAQGQPNVISDLCNHRLLHYSTKSPGNVWKLTAPSGEKRQVRAESSLSVNDGQSLLKAAKSGLGIAYLPCYLYAEAMNSEAVVAVIPDLPVVTQGL